MKVYSANEEDWNYFDISELMLDNDELKVGDTIWEGEATKPSILALVDADDIIDNMCDRACDYGGEWADDWCYHLVNSKEAKKALNESIKRWAKKHLEPINFYSVTNCKEYVLTEEDFEG